MAESQKLKLVDTPTAAKIAGMSARTFTRYARDNNIKGKPFQGNWFKWTEEQINEVRRLWVEAGAVKRKK